MKITADRVLQVVSELPVQDRFLVAGSCFLVTCLSLEAVIQLVMFIRKRRNQ